jgi:hypothetical protein
VSFPRFPIVSRYDGPWIEVHDPGAMDTAWTPPMSGWVLFEGNVYFGANRASWAGRLIAVERGGALLYDATAPRPAVPAIPTPTPGTTITPALDPKPGRVPLWPE